MGPSPLCQTTLNVTSPNRGSPVLVRFVLRRSLQLFLWGLDPTNYLAINKSGYFSAPFVLLPVFSFICQSPHSATWILWYGCQATSQLFWVQLLSLRSGLALQTACSRQDLVFLLSIWSWHGTTPMAERVERTPKHKQAWAAGLHHPWQRDRTKPQCACVSHCSTQSRGRERGHGREGLKV